MGKQNIVIIVLALLLVVALAFIGWNYYAAMKVNQQNAIYQQGAQLGYQQAFADVINSVATSCQPVPLVYGNATVTVINYACLQQSSGAPAQ
jgi:predicted negative regulator of RcsB-dependent stress response